MKTPTSPKMNEKRSLNKKEETSFPTILDKRSVSNDLM
jgi:hypothetical protein